MNNRHVDAAVVSAVLAYCALMWWPTRDLPFHWDSAGFVAFAAEDLLARNFAPFVVQYTPFAHPPLFMSALALGWKLFGTDLLVGHLLLLPFFPLLLLSTYGVGVRWYNRRVGMAAAALMASAPVVVAEYGQVYFDLPLAALLTFALWLWSTERRIAAGVVLGISVGIKIPAIVFPSVLLLVGLARLRSANERAARGAALRRLWPLAIPFVVLAAWLLYHHSVKGFWFQRPMRNSHAPHAPEELLRNAGRIAAYLFAQQRWMIAATGLLAAIAQLVRRRRSAQAVRLDAASATLALLVAIGIAFFAAADVFAQRYGILMMPAIFLLAAAALDALLGARQLAFAGVIAVGCALQVNGWLPAQTATNRPEYRPDENLHYLDMIALGRATADYMQREHPNAHVFGSWPEAYWLTDPLLGYVSRPIAFSDCRAYRPDVPGEKLIFKHLYSPDQPSCWQLIETTGAQPVTKLSSQAKWLQIFVVK